MNPCRSRAGALPLLMAVLLLAACGAERPQPGAADPPDPARFRSGHHQFPGDTWVEIERPADWGWSEAALADAHAYFEELEAAAVMIVHHGVLIAAWGEVAERYNSGSIRKAFLGALIGQEVAAGRLALDATLAQLDVDDSANPLTDRERTARVVDLLQSRGAIYLPAIYEAPVWKRHKPERGVHAPGETWFYSNWGFNALGTIFERTSGTVVERAFDGRIAEPIGMEDYRPRDVHYLRQGDLSEKMQGNASEHAAAVFMISTRDLARFGQLYLAGGRWRDRQVVPAGWVERTFGEHVPTHPAMGGDRYGYLWWVSPGESELGRAVGHEAYKATGGRGHKLVVVPDLDLVVAHQPATGGVALHSQLRRRFFGSPTVSDGQFNELMRRIVAAHPDG